MPNYDGERFAPPAPLAIVTLLSPDRRKSLPGISMLIDSGADLSLLPATAVSKLGLAIDAQHGYELMGFDGVKSVANSVECGMAFLGRVYFGRYMVIDDQCGILGRDVLNHVSLLLDGPGLKWQEATKPD
jgi:hypothetical protein